MLADGLIYQRLSDSLHDFLRPLGMHADSGTLRVLRELVFGLVFTGSPQLSNAARLFCDCAGQLADAVERMSRHLADKHFDHRQWMADALQLCCEAIEDDDLIPIDGTDLAKPYARRMQHLCTIRDASNPLPDALVNGYWCFGCHHWSPDDHTLAPVMLRPWSSTAPDFRSENDLTDRWLWSLRQATAGRGIWLIDRGGDRPTTLSTLLRMQKKWIVRLRGDRKLIGPDNSIRSAQDWANHALLTRPPRGHAVTLKVRLPPQDIPQHGPVPTLWLVVPTREFIRNNKPERWLLLCCGLIDQHAGPRQIRHDYALRWRAEDAKRFIGQLLHVETFLTRSMLALERMLCCVCLAAAFLAMLQRDEPHYCEQLEAAPVHWRDDDKIPAYRLARGVQALTMRTGHTFVTTNA